MFWAAAHSISPVLFSEKLECVVEMVDYQLALCSDHLSFVICCTSNQYWMMPDYGRQREWACILGQYSCHIPGHKEVRRGLGSEYDFFECTKIKVSRTYNNRRAINVAKLRFLSFHDITTMEYVGMQWNSNFKYWDIPWQKCSGVLFYVICKTSGYVLL